MIDKKGIYILLVVLLLCAISVSAVSFSAELVPVRDKIPVTDQAEFKLTVSNHGPSIQQFRIKTIDYPRWDIRTRPVKNPILVDVYPFSNTSMALFIKPNVNLIAPQGSYFVNIEVIAESTEEKKTLQARVGLISSKEQVVEYVPTVVAKTNLQKSIDPSEEVSFQVTLSNQNNLEMHDAKLILSSNLINEELMLDILGKEEKVVEFNIKMDPMTQPQEDWLKISLVYEGKDVFMPFETKYQIMSYSTIYDKRVVEKSFLGLIRKETITFKNVANVPFSGDFTVLTNLWKRLFGSAEPDAVIVKENGKSYYSWSSTLPPDGKFTVEVKENYLGLILLIIAVGVFGVILYLKRSPIVLRKEITESEFHEGGLSKLSVLINVKNRSLRKIDEISIVDKVPKLLEIEKHTILGSLRPKNIKKNKKHETLMLWTIEDFTPGEERVITYQLRSSLKILGGLTLQPAVAKFRDKEKEIKVRSNRTFVRS